MFVSLDCHQRSVHLTSPSAKLRQSTRQRSSNVKASPGVHLCGHLILSPSSPPSFPLHGLPNLESCWISSDRLPRASWSQLCGSVAHLRLCRSFQARRYGSASPGCRPKVGSSSCCHECMSLWSALCIPRRSCTS